MKLIYDYVEKLSQRYSTGVATEHSYRGDLQNLLETIVTDITVTNEPRRVACGAPDYILSKGKLDIGYIEAKDIGKNLKDKSYKEQFDRYKSSLPNLIFTDYMDFHFYREGEFQTNIKIAQIDKNKILPMPENFETFVNLINDFVTYVGITVKSADKLAKIMAGKSRMMADVIEKSLTSDVEIGTDSSIKDQFVSFKQILIEDITEKSFADVYSQTIAYGMFAARLHDETLEDFSRQEAASLIPKSNPFLRKLFQYIAGYELDDRLVWIVDSLVDVFRATDVKAILANFGKMTQRRDPIIHFYETFLAEYDPKLRKSRGVWYTPEPVVQFIVKSVDLILKDEFGLKEGLADTSKVERKILYQDGRGKKETHTFHKVQILDPATGTGTFLAEVIKQIYSKFKGMQGIWNSYVEKDLIPRLHGFELLMASYAMAHLKLELLLKETGYKSEKNQRLRVYLTNSLEEYHPFTGTTFTSWLSNEANEANYVKRDAPIMVAIGNPPYSGHSANKGKWMDRLMLDYKKEPTGGKLKEKNSKWLNDDYVKFIRYGQYYIEENGEGILAYINNNGWISNPTFRGMRYSLLKAFDKIYIIDLHGNSKKKETCPDGSKDENVFDIQQGVSINIFIKTNKGRKKKNEFAEVYHTDMFGSRNLKYDQLDKSIAELAFKNIRLKSPSYLFINHNDRLYETYKKGFSLVELFPVNNTGVITKRDKLTINFDKNRLWNNIQYFINNDEKSVRRYFNLPPDVRDWKFSWAKDDLLSSGPTIENIKVIHYRPFDYRYIYYTGKSRGFVGWPVPVVSEHFIRGDNLGIVSARSNKSSNDADHVFISKYMMETKCGERTTQSAIFPIYLYLDAGWEDCIEKPIRTPNLNMDIVTKIANKLKLAFTNEKEDRERTFSPVDILDYIYAVLHSPSYRDKYKEFLKIDFPRVPYPEKAEIFWALVTLGRELRGMHLLESSKVTEYITEYPESGDNIITTKIGKVDFKVTDEGNKLGRVMINENQYFDKIPVVSWNFYIGGYQPAQKWLKDRYGRELSYEDIAHYQKIIVALNETNRLMQEIDKLKLPWI
ncbi:MAG TPA: DNA methyltransferase [Bacteroidales bacterium]|nr:DNA methyltransferase [Bacteroidales bacterium]